MSFKRQHQLMSQVELLTSPGLAAGAAVGAVGLAVGIVVGTVYGGTVYVVGSLYMMPVYVFYAWTGTSAKNYS